MTLPTGFRVRLADGVISTDHGRVLVGGSPLTAVRLSDRARTMLVGDTVAVADEHSAHLAERLLATNLAVPELQHHTQADARDLTVVIPAHDRADQLDRTLAALRPLHCIVVDDASSGPASVAETAKRHGATLLRLETNVGPAGARNAGLTHVNTPFVAFVDSDVEVTAADLLRLTGHFHDPSVALVGPRIQGVARSANPRWFERYDAVTSSLTLGRTSANVRPGAAVAWLPSACLVARTDLLGAGFDATMRVGEDVDLVWRLTEAGHRVRYDPTVEARHDARPTLREWLGRKAYYGSGGARLAARHGSNLAPAVLSPTYATAAAVLLVRRRWSPLAAVVLLTGTNAVRSKLPEGPGRTAIAARLATRGLGWAVRQESSLLVRHWWPSAALGAVFSKTVRRALVTAVVVDGVVALTEHHDARERLSPVWLLLGRRLDDLAYGAGLWWGALRQRSARVLTPRSPGAVSQARTFRPIDQAQAPAVGSGGALENVCRSLRPSLGRRETPSGVSEIRGRVVRALAWTRRIRMESSTARRSQRGRGRCLLMKVACAETHTSPSTLRSPTVRILRPSTASWRPVINSSESSGVGRWYRSVSVPVMPDTPAHWLAMSSV
jgi:mycofactocin system glycosyltransferase